MLSLGRLCNELRTCSGGCVRDTIWHEVVGKVCGYITLCQTHHTHISTLPFGPSTQRELLSFPYSLQVQGWYLLIIVGFIVGLRWCW